MMNSKKGLFITGAVVGLAAILLTWLGNPKNMGFCIACFIRDTAGALGLHQATAVQYARPEIIGLILGATLIALIRREFAPKGGSSPFTRLMLGAMMMICALVFLGCPLRMVLRIAGGDLNAIVGLAGFAAGIGVGVVFLKRGFSLGRNYKLRKAEGLWLPAVQIVLLVLLGAGLLLSSAEGPGSLRAPLLASLGAGLVVGALAQRSRLCFAGGVRDLLLFKDWTLLMGLVGTLVAALVGNLVLNSFQLGFAGQPIAHTDGLWNFLSMVGVGLAATLLGGCPLRQLILAGEGNGDAAITTVGMLLGAAISHNFKLASSATVIKDGVASGGPTMAGKIITVVILVILVGLAVANSKKQAVKEV